MELQKNNSELNNNSIIKNHSVIEKKYVDEKRNNKSKTLFTNDLNNKTIKERKHSYSNIKWLTGC